MRLKGRYYPVYGATKEKTLQYCENLILEYAIRSYFIKIYRGFTFYVCGKLLIILQKMCVLLHKHKEKYLLYNLTINDILTSLINEYKEETNLDITFQKDFGKTLSTKEKENIIKNSKKELKEKYNYLLEVHDLLKQKYQKYENKNFK